MHEPTESKLTTPSEAPTLQVVEVKDDQVIGSPEVAEADKAKAGSPNCLLFGRLVMVTVCGREGVVNELLIAGADLPTALYATTWIL